LSYASRSGPSRKPFNIPNRTTRSRQMSKEKLTLALHQDPPPPECLLRAVSSVLCCGPSPRGRSDDTPQKGGTEETWARRSTQGRPPGCEGSHRRPKSSPLFGAFCGKCRWTYRHSGGTAAEPRLCTPAGRSEPPGRAALRTSFPLQAATRPLTARPPRGTPAAGRPRRARHLGSANPAPACRSSPPAPPCGACSTPATRSAVSAPSLPPAPRRLP